MPEKKDFVIKDKRMFSQEAQEQKAEETPEEETHEAQEEAQQPEDTAETEAPETDYQLPEINFATFIFSLNSSTLVHLGVIDDPATGKQVKNLALAKQTIDILGMLEEKTHGNLTPDEESMLRNILYELRMIYVKQKG